ncbi:DUF6479 family protein [Streptomyces sp. M10(2022)]
MDPFLSEAVFLNAVAEDSTAGWPVLIAVGVLVAGLLVGLVWWDSRRKRARAPRPDEQPRARPPHRDRGGAGGGIPAEQRAQPV